MLIWSFASPRNSDFARASRLGEWGKDANGKVVRVSPLVIEWEPISSKIGDVTVVGLNSDVVAKKEVASKIKAAGIHGFREGLVIVKREKGVRRIPSKESDSELVELVAEAWIDCELTRSSVIEEKTPAGEAQLRLLGLEHVESNWDREKGALVERRIPRKAGAGIIVPMDLVEAPIIFRVSEFPVFFCCNDRAKLILQDLGVTNLDFFEIGEGV